MQTIAPLSPLPAITNPVLIDGFSQPGYAGTPLIELSGSQAGGGDGLTITGPDVTVRGLDINSFSQGAGIHLTGTGATGDWIYGNFLGTDPTGTQAEPNDYGVEIDGGASDNLIGTNGDGVNDAAERNLISAATPSPASGSRARHGWQCRRGQLHRDRCHGSRLDNVWSNYGTSAVGESIVGRSGNRIGIDGTSVDADSARKCHLGQSAYDGRRASDRHGVD